MKFQLENADQDRESIIRTFQDEKQKMVDENGDAIKNWELEKNRLIASQSTEFEKSKHLEDQLKNRLLVTMVTCNGFVLTVIYRKVMLLERN